jgi:hypothetical protein
LTDHRCPECGAPFDPNDPGSFDKPGFRTRFVRAVGWAAGVFLFLYLACTFSWVVLKIDLGGAAGVLSWVIACVGTLAFLAIVALRER